MAKWSGSWRGSVKGEKVHCESKLQHSTTKELLKGTGVHKEMDCGGGGGGGDVIRRLILSWNRSTRQGIRDQLLISSTTALVDTLAEYTDVMSGSGWAISRI